MRARTAPFFCYAADIASVSAEPPDPRALVGVCETCENIEELTRTVRRSLPIEALEIALRKQR